MSELDRFENIRQGLPVLDTFVAVYRQREQIWYGGIIVGDKMHTLRMIRARASDFMREQIDHARFCFPELENMRDLFWQRGSIGSFKKWLSMDVYVCDIEMRKSRGKLAEIFIKDILNALLKDIGYGERFCAVIVPREYDIKNEGEEGGDIAIFYCHKHIKIPICLLDVTTARCDGNGIVQKSPGFNTASGTAIPVIILPLGGYDILGYQGDEYQISRFLDKIVRSAIALGMYHSDNPLYFLPSDKRESFENFVIRRIMKGIVSCKEHFISIPEHASLPELRDSLDGMQKFFKAIQGRV